MMDLGATVCLPKRPRCTTCPVKDWCSGPAAYTPPTAQGRFERFGSTAARGHHPHVGPAYRKNRRHRSTNRLRPRCGGSCDQRSRRGGPRSARRRRGLSDCGVGRRRATSGRTASSRFGLPEPPLRGAHASSSRIGLPVPPLRGAPPHPRVSGSESPPARRSTSSSRFGLPEPPLRGARPHLRDSGSQSPLCEALRLIFAIRAPRAPAKRSASSSRSAPRAPAAEHQLGRVSPTLWGDDGWGVSFGGGRGLGSRCRLGLPRRRSPRCC